MFNLKNMFGGGLDISAMIGPMLPGIIKDAAPKLVQSFDQKALDLEEELDLYITNDAGFIEEIVPFVSKRNGQLQMDWVLLTHTNDGDGNWTVEITETLETVTMKEFMESAMVGITNQTKPVKNLPAEPKRLRGISDAIKSAPLPGNLDFSEQKEYHDRYFLEKNVVISFDNSLQVIEGPAPENVMVWYGHEDEVIAQNWADVKNLQLQLK
jgi:hypothetical protein